jgi:hypothetical protein
VAWHRGTRTVLVLALLASAAAGCGTDADRDQARAAAEALYAAVEAGDGQAACRQLSPQARQELEGQEQEECPDAILGLELAGVEVERVEVFLNEAAVHLSGGETVFLDETQQGWRVSALGCREQSTNRPADCEVQA